MLQPRLNAAKPLCRAMAKNKTEKGLCVKRRDGLGEGGGGRVGVGRGGGLEVPEVDAGELEEPKANASVMLCSTSAAETQRNRGQVRHKMESYGDTRVKQG